MSVLIDSLGFQQQAINTSLFAYVLQNLRRREKKSSVFFLRHCKRFSSVFGGYNSRSILNNLPTLCGHCFYIQFTETTIFSADTSALTTFGACLFFTLSLPKQNPGYVCTASLCFQQQVTNTSMFAYVLQNLRRRNKIFCFFFLEAL